MTALAMKGAMVVASACQTITSLIDGGGRVFDLPDQTQLTVYYVLRTGFKAIKGGDKVAVCTQGLAEGMPLLC